MSAPITDNSFQPLASLAELRTIPALRVTQIAKLFECPRQWKAIMLGEGERFDSPAGRIGTAVHLVIERFLGGEFELCSQEWHEQAIYLEAQGVPAAERRMVEGYLREIGRYRPYVLALEHEFLKPLVLTAPKIKGHIDAVFVPYGGPLTIRDHKTNRQFKDADWWRQQWQPRLYSWAARVLWPTRAANVVFQIGYVNLGVVVQWEADPLDWFDLEARYREAWEGALLSMGTDRWGEHTNDNCGFCPVRLACETSKAATTALLGSFAGRLRNS